MASQASLSGAGGGEGVRKSGPAAWVTHKLSSTILQAAPPVFKETEPPGWLKLRKPSRPARRDAVEWIMIMFVE